MHFSLFFFVIIPFAEIMLLLEVSERIGGWNTVLVVLGTAVLGISLLRRQGFSTMTRFQQRLRSGELPAQEIVEGMIIAFCGALLLAPGFITDSVGILGLLPPVRKAIARRILRSGGAFMSGGPFTMGSQFQYRETRFDQGDIIEGDVVDEEPRSRHGLGQDGE